MEGFSKMIFVTMHGMNLVRREEILDKLQMDAARARFKDDEKIEGRHENYIEQVEHEKWRREFSRDEP